MQKTELTIHHKRLIGLVLLATIVWLIWPVSNALTADQGQLSSTQASDINAMPEYERSITEGVPADYFVFSPKIADDAVYAFTYSQSTTNWFVNKYTPGGDLLFAKQMEGSPSVGGTAIDSVGDIYAVGEMGINKYDSNGNKIATLNAYMNSSIYTGEDTGAGNIVVAPNGLIYIAIVASDAETGTTRNYLAQLDATGNILQYREFSDYIMALALSPTGQLYAGTGNSDTMQESILAVSTQDLTSQVQITGIDVSYELAVDMADNFYVLGFQISDDEDSVCSGLSSTSILKYSKTGTKLGEISFGSTAAQKPGGEIACVMPAYGIAVSANGSTIYAPSDDYSGAELVTPRLLKYSSPQNQATFSPQTTAGSVTSKQVLILPEMANITDAKLATPQESGLSDGAGLTYPFGVTSFTASVATASSIPVDLIIESDVDPGRIVVRKYNTTTKRFTDISGLTVVKTTNNGKSALKVHYIVTDGGMLDEDGIVNGVIVDPVVVAVKAQTSGGSTGSGVSDSSSTSVSSQSTASPVPVSDHATDTAAQSETKKPAPVVLQRTHETSKPVVVEKQNDNFVWLWVTSGALIVVILLIVRKKIADHNKKQQSPSWLASN